MSKVTFSGTNRTITVNSGVTSIDVTIDVYSEWKEWVLISNNAKYPQAIRTFGGDETTFGQFAPSYFFLTNGWRLVVDNLTLLVTGNLYTNEGDSPFLNVNSNITHKTTDASIVSTGTIDLTQVLLNQQIINQGVQKASLLIPHTTNL